MKKICEIFFDTQKNIFFQDTFLENKIQKKFSNFLRAEKVSLLTVKKFSKLFPHYILHFFEIF